MSDVIKPLRPSKPVHCKGYVSTTLEGLHPRRTGYPEPLLAPGILPKA